MTEVMPTAAIATSAINPVIVPARVARPPESPPESVAAMIRAMFGPGVTARRMQVATKVVSTVAVIRTPSSSEKCTQEKQSPSARGRLRKIQE